MFKNNLPLSKLLLCPINLKQFQFLITILLPDKIISFKSAVDADEDEALGLATISDENGDNSLNVEIVDEGDEEFCWLVFTSNIELDRRGEERKKTLDTEFIKM